MFTQMNTQIDLKPLADFVKEQMERRGWGLRTLATYSQLAPATLSKLLNSKTVPRAETLSKLAEILEVDEAHLFRLAGHIHGLDDKHLDPSARYIAQRLSELPDGVREKAIDAVSGVVDGFSQIAEEDAPKESNEVVDLTIFPEADRNLISQLEPVFQEYLAALMKQGASHYLEAMNYARTRADAEMRRRAVQPIHQG